MNLSVLSIIEKLLLLRWTSDGATAEVGTVQVEMRDLSRASGDRKYEVCSIRSISLIN